MLSLTLPLNRAWDFSHGCPHNHAYRSSKLAQTPPQDEQKVQRPSAPTPLVLANDIHGAFNCVNHQRVHEIMSNFKLPSCVSGTIRSLLNNLTISLPFGGEMEPPAPFLSRRPQGSPPSPVLFILYSSAMTTIQLTALQAESWYVDNEVLSQGVTARRIRDGDAEE